MKQCLIQNLMTGEIFFVGDSDRALDLARSENIRDKRHPAFNLLTTNDGVSFTLFAVLHRDFGSDVLYWKQIAR